MSTMSTMNTTDMMDNFTIDSSTMDSTITDNITTTITTMDVSDEGTVMNDVTMENGTLNIIYTESSLYISIGMIAGTLILMLGCVTTAAICARSMKYRYKKNVPPIHRDARGSIFYQTFPRLRPEDGELGFNDYEEDTQPSIHIIDPRLIPQADASGNTCDPASSGWEVTPGENNVLYTPCLTGNPDDTTYESADLESTGEVIVEFPPKEVPSEAGYQSDPSPCPTPPPLPPPVSAEDLLPDEEMNTALDEALKVLDDPESDGPQVTHPGVNSTAEICVTADGNQPQLSSMRNTCQTDSDGSCSAEEATTTERSTAGSKKLQKQHSYENVVITSPKGKDNLAFVQDARSSGGKGYATAQLESNNNVASPAINFRTNPRVSRNTSTSSLKRKSSRGTSVGGEDLYTHVIPPHLRRNSITVTATEDPDQF